MYALRGAAAMGILFSEEVPHLRQLRLSGRFEMWLCPAVFLVLWAAAAEIAASCVNQCLYRYVEQGLDDLSRFYNRQEAWHVTNKYVAISQS